MPWLKRGINRFIPLVIWQPRPQVPVTLQELPADTRPYHRDLEDYWPWTLDGLRLFARQHGFVEMRSGVHLGPTSAMNDLIIAYWQSWFRDHYIRKGIDLVLSWLLFPLKYLDVFAPRGANDMPSGLFLVGRKPGQD